MPNNSFGNIDGAGRGVKRRGPRPGLRIQINVRSSRRVAALVAAVQAMTRSKCDNMSRTRQGDWVAASGSKRAPSGDLSQGLQAQARSLLILETVLDSEIL